MNLFRLLKQRAQNPVRVGVIGAGKFGTMFVSQALFTPGLKIVAIADLDPEKARQACLRTGWPEDALCNALTTGAIEDAARAGKMALTPDASALIEADLDVVVEVTGIPEAGTVHAVAAFEAQRDVVMVNVEADCLLGPLLRKRAEAAGCVYSMAYGDQPALIAEQIDWARAIGMQLACAGKGTRYQPHFRYSTPQTVWGHYGFSEEQVATGDYNAQMFNSFLDGTKSAIEMCAVCNACSLVPQSAGLQFPPVGVSSLADVLKPVNDGGILEHQGTVEVVASEDRDGVPLDDNLRWGVYVVFKAPSAYVRRCFTEYGLRADRSGAYAALHRPYHLIGLELGVSVASAALRREPTGSAKEFTGDVAAVAKDDLRQGQKLDGEGGYTVYGRLVQATESLKGAYLPMGLTADAHMVRSVTRDSILTYADVKLDHRLLSYKLRKSMEKEQNSEYRCSEG